MSEQKTQLPQLGDKIFLTDGGMETTLIFHEGWDLPHAEAFVLVDSEEGRNAIHAYFGRYLALAREHGVGFVLESPTWRANPDWAAKIGYDRDRLAVINRAAIGLMREVRAAYEGPSTPIVISGNVGPRGDGYDAGHIMSVEEAEGYHAWQVGELADAGADFVSAFTMTNVNEAAGFARAADKARIASVVSFTVETDGRLPTGDLLAEAIDAVDQATGGAPAYYMINCAYPTHFADTLALGGAALSRIKGIRANSSCRSHAELDNSPELDTGNPVELGAQYRALFEDHPWITVLGGCCGTDHRHVAEIAKACC